jgi:cation diffusion facilitator CzcD-associated flavoprotein CzcO
MFSLVEYEFYFKKKKKKIVIKCSMVGCRHYAVPLIPKLEGLDSFSGEIMHSHNYRVPEAFKGKRVICLGANASGQDICLDLAPHADTVSCSGLFFASTTAF